MTELDPYFRNSLDGTRQVVLAARPIVIAQGGADQDGVVPIAAGHDVVVIADEVTIRGTILARHAPPTAPPPPPWPSNPQDAAIAGPSGCTVLILARSIDTIPGKAPDGKATNARLDASGGDGQTSTNIVVAAPAATGTEGEPGHSIWHPITDDVAPGGTGGRGDPGKKGDEGGDGGTGGTIDIRCGFTRPTTALTAVVDGGNGGTGMAGQAGGTGGQGGAGADSEVYWIGHPSAATEGGPGGPGGPGGDGGAAGKGGAPGAVRIRVRNGQPSGITASLHAGSPGTPGDAGGGGGGGWGGQGGRPWGIIGYAPAGQGGAPLYDWKPRVGFAVQGATGGKGSKPGELKPAADGTADVVGTCEDSELVKSLTFRVTAQTALLLDRIQVDYLAATGAVDPENLSALGDRIDWTNALLGAYSPAADETGELDSQRAAALVVKERFQASLDFYGNATDYAPLGSIQSYQERFAGTLTALESIQRECDDRVTALEKASRTASDLAQAQNTLTQQQRAYDAAAEAERATIAELITQIGTADAEAIAAKDTLSKSAFTDFESAVQSTCGISMGDLIDVLGQLAFLGQEPFQAGAMIVSQAAKLGEAAASKVLDKDGSPVDKKLVIGQLTATDLSKDKLTAIVGGESGVRLSDPGAIKLIAEQSKLDELCDKLWTISGAAKAKEAFDEYVSAVQARNAHVMTLNESLSRLRAYVAGSAQTAAAIATAQTQAAASTDAGAVTLVTQLTRMASRARADCIEALYLASRAYSFWALEHADALAGVLSDLSAGLPLAMTPTALQAAGEQLLTRYDKTIDTQLGERPIWLPPKNAPATARGKLIELTPQSHPAVFEQLRTKRWASFQLTAPRAGTTADSNPFAGLSDVRLTSVRCWLSGVRWADGRGPIVRVDLEHQGREILISPKNTVAVFRHEPVHVMIEYDSTKPLDPDAIVAASDLQDGDSKANGALIGPFARWRVRVNDALNPGVDLSAVDKITLEMRLSAQPFG